MNKKLFQWSFLHASLAFFYIFSIVELLFNGEKFFGDIGPSVMAPILMLMLLVLSVAVMGMLFFAKPVMMYIDNQKKEAVKMLGYTVGWFLLLLIVVIFTLFIF